jgi:L-lysine 2,3-aminomutase
MLYDVVVRAVRRAVVLPRARCCALCRWCFSSFIRQSATSAQSAVPVHLIKETRTRAAAKSEYITQ